MRVSTSDALVLPVTTSDFADWLGIASTDTLLTTMLTTATSMIISYLQHDLISREWVASIDVMPAKGSAEGIGGELRLSKKIYLPYGMTDVESVTAEDVALVEDTDYEVLIQYGRVDLKSLYKYDIEITYTAGFGNSAANVPAEIKDGIKMLAAWLYENRGGCTEGKNPVIASGAASVIHQHKTEMI